MSDRNTLTLIDLLLRRSRELPDARAFTFLADGENEVADLAYGELDRRARAIAAALQRRHDAGERALLMYPPGLDFVAAFFGCLYAGVIAVPVYPPRPGGRMRGLDRCLAIARDAGVSIVLGTDRFVDLLDPASNRAPELKKAHWLSTEDPPLRDADYWRQPLVHRGAVAFLQYTSGSTAAPRGVMVSHANLMHNLAYAHHCSENDAGTISVSWLPVHHDMGLVNGVLLPVYAGYPSYLMPPTACIQRPARWLEAISRYRATNSGGPNFAYELCLRKVTRRERQGLDLGCWRVAYNGAEPIRWTTLEQFYETFRECGFRRQSHYPVYGLAEATVLVSSGRRSYEPRAIRLDPAQLALDRAIEARETDADALSVVCCGPVSCGIRVAIVRPETCSPCEPGEVGEIWVRSPSVALGYWNLPHETRQTFRAQIAGDAGEPFLRTGDLGFLSRGELVVTGRIKECIVVRGRKHYPQDIERTVEECHDAVRTGCAAAFALDDEEHREQLAVVAEIERRQMRREAVLETVLAVAREAIAERHGIRPQLVALVRPGSLPKTSSGKLQRHICRRSLQANELRTVAQWVAASHALTGVA